MADSANLSIPSSAAERADINTITQLLAWYRNGDLNNEQMIKAIRDWAKVSQIPVALGGHTHSFDEDISNAVEGEGTTKRCVCGARLWAPTLAHTPHDAKGGAA